MKSLEGAKSLYIAGIVEIAKTTVSLWKTEPGAFVYLLASMFNEAAIGSFTNLSITYLTEQLEMTSTSIIIFIMINFATNPIGVIIHRYVSRFLYPFLFDSNFYISNFCVLESVQLHRSEDWSQEELLALHCIYSDHYSVPHIVRLRTE